MAGRPPLIIPNPAVQPPTPLVPSPDPLQPARQEFARLERWLFSAPALRLPLHHVEPQQEIKGRQVQRLLLQAHIQARGQGDVGRALLVREGNQPILYTHRRIRPRLLKTIFGSITLTRMAYSRRGGPHSIYPLDEMLQLPSRSFSYELQKRAIKAAVQGPFQESLASIAQVTGLSIPKRSLAEILVEAAQDFDTFYREQAPQPDSGALLVAAVDGKGIPMLQPQGAPRKVRPAKGEKRNRKRMATVATVFSRLPWVRTPEQIVESLFRTCPCPKSEHPLPPRPENKRVWASLIKGKATVIAEVAQEMQRRDPQHTKTWVALTDGERALQSWLIRPWP
jgi:hypothetical protein